MKSTLLRMSFYRFYLRVIRVHPPTMLSCPLEEGHRMMPVKTVCQIIDVDFSRQDSWLKSHQFYSQLYKLTYTVGADGKERKMNCLSIFDIDGWVNSIGPQNRSEESIQKQYLFLAWLRERKLELYKSIDLFMQENRYELELIEMKERTLDELEAARDNVKELQKKYKQISTTIEDVRAKRYTGQTALPFPDSE